MVPRPRRSGHDWNHDTRHRCTHRHHLCRDEGRWATLAAGDSVGEVESVKTTSDIYTAVTGEVEETNAAVVDDPSLVNSDPYGEGWLIRIKTTDTTPLESLMDAGAYDQMNG